MALQERVVSITLEAAADYSADQFTFMQVDANGRAVQAGAGATAIGVLQNKPSALGRDATVAIVGSVTKVVSAGTIAAGARIMSDANGEALTATATNHILGTAMTAAAAGDVFPVLLGTNNVL